MLSVSFGAVKRNTAGAVKVTAMPCGTMEWSEGFPSRCAGTLDSLVRIAYNPGKIH
jgi:hypothetical protein